MLNPFSPTPIASYSSLMRRSDALSPEFNSSILKMEISKLQFRIFPSSSSFSLLSWISSPYNAKHTRGTLWISVAVSSAVAAIFCFFLLLKSDGGKRFSIVIDGGSTGTRIHVYSYVMRRGMMLPVVDFFSSTTMKVSPGLSAYSENPEAAGESLVDLLEFGRRTVKREMWEETDIRLMATAGMRLIDVGVQERILDSCRKVMRMSGFRFRREWANVITGLDEGIYAWVTANYAVGTLGKAPEKTTGVIELGGASVQLTFVSSEQLPPEFMHVLRYGKTMYNLYSHSFLHLGQNVAYEALHTHLSSESMKSYPCIPKGFRHSPESELSSGVQASKSRSFTNILTSGNFSQCRSAALMLLQRGKDICLHKHCHIGSVFVPEMKGRFLATENFFYTSKFFGLGSTSVLSDLVVAGEEFCGEDWFRLKEKYHFLVGEDLLRYCFSSAYIVAILHDSLGLGLNDRRIEFANQVGDVPLDWALGAFIMNIMSGLDWEIQHSLIDITMCNYLLLLFIFVTSVLAFTM